MKGVRAVVNKTKVAIIKAILDSEKLSSYSKEDAIRIVAETKVETALPRVMYATTSDAK